MKRMLCMSCCTEKTFVACLFAFDKMYCDFVLSGNKLYFCK